MALNKYNKKISFIVKRTVLNQLFASKIDLQYDIEAKFHPSSNILVGNLLFSVIADDVLSIQMSGLYFGNYCQIP